MSHPLDNFIFFGSSEFSIVVLESLKKENFLPSIIVTLPDSLSGRGLKKTLSPVKIWAIENKIKLFEPKVLDDTFFDQLKDKSYELFLVAAYGKIIPIEILNLPNLGSFNIHPSLLPKYRGPSPIQSQILADEKNVGVSIIKMDEKVDHGLILAESEINSDSQIKIKLPIIYRELGKILFEKGASLLIENLLNLSLKNLELKSQNDSQATFTKKFLSEDGKIDLNSGYSAYLKYLALSQNVGVFFEAKKKDNVLHVKIKEAKYENSQFVPVRVVPEGKKEMSYADFLRGLN